MRVLVKEYQLDPVAHQLLHADFYQVAMDQAINVSRADPSDRRGQGRQGPGRRRRVRQPRASRCSACRPTFLSSSTVDVTELMLHQAIRVRDLAGRPKVEAGDRPRDAHRPRRRAEGRRAEAPAADAAAAPRGARRAGAEPEVIKKGKTDKDDEGAEEVVRGRLDCRSRRILDQEYRETRHNVGFMVVDELARRHDLVLAMAPAHPRTKWREFWTTPSRWLVKPLTFMNLSGEAVGGAGALSRHRPERPAGSRGRGRSAAGAHCGRAREDRPAPTTV